MFKESIALLQGLVVGREGFDITLVGLRDDNIHEATPFLAATCNEAVILGRDHDKRDQSDVLGDATIHFLVAFQHLFHTSFHPHIDLLVLAILALVLTLDHSKFLIVANAQRVDTC